MPRYNKKITRPMDYDEFKEGIVDLPIQKRAFLSVLFFSGCRVSEALALTDKDINCAKESIFISFFRLKNSTQTDPIPLPRTDALEWLCLAKGQLFPFTRRTALRWVKKVFSDLYPHYFRSNRFTDLAEKFPLATIISFSGLSPMSVKYYISKVDIKRVGVALQKETT